MKKKIFTLILTVALTTMSTTTFATEIPRESTPLNATEKQTQIVENLIGDILDDVQTGNLGYTLAAGYANTKIQQCGNYRRNKWIRIWDIITDSTERNPCYV